MAENCSDIYIRQIVREQLNSKAEGAEGLTTVYSLICITMYSVKLKFKNEIERKILNASKNSKLTIC